MRKEVKSTKTEKGLHAATKIDKISMRENGKRQPFPLYKNIRSHETHGGSNRVQGEGCCMVAKDGAKRSVLEHRSHISVIQ